MIKYYEENFEKYIEETFNSDMSSLYYFFEKYLNSKTSKILDIGFGSGRDSIYFINKGYEVYSLDPVQKFCDNGKKIGLKNIFCMKAQDIYFINEFDGIWACASLLHIPSNELVDVLNRCYSALKDDGVMYCSFKYGNYEGVRGEIFFHDLTEESLKEVLDNSDFKLIDVIVSDDVNLNRTVKWLNIILKKINDN